MLNKFRRHAAVFFGLVLLIAFPQFALAAGSTSYATGGTFFFTVPAYGNLTVEMWGAGGSGSGWIPGAYGSQGGGGGGYVKKTYAQDIFAPGAQVRVMVGSINNSVSRNYACGFGANAGGQGGATLFYGTPVLSAAGGNGGQFATEDFGVGQTPNGGSATYGDINIPGTSGGWNGNAYGGSSYGGGNASPNTNGTSPGGGGGGGTPTCGFSGGGGGGLVNISWTDPAPATCSISIAPNPASYSTSGTATLSWSTFGADISMYITNVGYMSGKSGSFSIPRTASASYNGTAVGSGGTGTCSTTFTVTPPAVGTATITSSAGANISVGQSSTITAVFSPTAADPLSEDNIDSPVGAGVGADTNPTSPKTYTFTPSAPGTYSFYARAKTSYYTSWATYAQTTITVAPALACGVTFDQNPIAAGGSTVVRWFSSSAVGYRMNTIGYQTPNAVGSMTVSPLVTTDYSGTATSSTSGGGVPVRIYITTGTTWTVPTDWNSANNSIEVIGGGGGAGDGVIRSSGGPGGGGGAYAKKINVALSPGATVSIQVGAGGAHTIAGTDTVFNSTATTCAGSPAPTVCAKGGFAGSGFTGGTGGTAAASIGTTKYNGGAGRGTFISRASGHGGGGAAGPSGVGALGGMGTAYGVVGGGGGGGGGNGGGTMGSNGTGDSNGGAGGNNVAAIGGGTGGTSVDSGYDGVAGGGGGGGFGTLAAGVGGVGADWDSSHGSGGGGGGGGNTSVFAGNGKAGGLYGGGGGGGAASQTTAGIGASGANGIIVVTYTPAPWQSIQTATCPATLTVACTPSYSCSGQTIRYTDASCSVSSVATCVAPSFCSAGSSLCIVATPTFNSNSGAGTSGHLQSRPQLIARGTSARLYWNLSNATCSVTGSNGDNWTGAASAVTGQATAPITGKTVYTLNCTGLDSSTITEQITINVTPLYKES